MAESELALITHDNAAGLSLAQQAAVQRNSRENPLSGSAWDSAEMTEGNVGYVEGVIVYHVKKITSIIAERASCCFRSYHAAELLTTLWLRSKEPTNFLIFNYGGVMKLCEVSEANVAMLKNGD